MAELESSAEGWPGHITSQGTQRFTLYWSGVGFYKGQVTPDRFSAVPKGSVGSNPIWCKVGYFILVLSCAAHRALVVQKEQNSFLDFSMEDGFDTRSFFNS